MVRVVVRGEPTSERFEQEVVDDLVNAVVVPREPVVDGGQVTQNPTGDARLLGDLAHGRLLSGFRSLEVALGQAPLETAAAIAARDDRGDRAAPPNGDHQSARTGLVDDR